MEHYSSYFREAFTDAVETDSSNWVNYAENVFHKLKEVSDNSALLTFLIDDNNDLVTHAVENKKYIVCYTDWNIVQSGEYKSFDCDVNVIVKELMLKEEYSGLIVNPYTAGLTLETGSILAAIFGDFYQVDTDNKASNIINQDKPLNDFEMLNFSMSLFSQKASEEGFIVVFGSNDVNAIVNTILLKDNCLYFVKIRGSIVEASLKIRKNLKEEIGKISQRFKTIGAYQAILFTNLNSDKQLAGIMGRNDRFNVKYLDMQIINNASRNTIVS